MIGTILSNRYRILRELGAGGMAKVYLAEDINQSQMVAVKILHSQFGEDLSYVQRFKREAKLASLLTSPHIVNIIDYGSSRDTHFLVMEYVEGQDLREILDRRGPFPWKEAFGLIDQICQALENANEYNVVHRDIKPQNIMITEQGQLKVLDFGIARARMLPSLTQSGFVGSPYYISPEQAMGDEVDIRSDIYSTGIVLYELLTGQVPFDSKSPWSIISKHIASEFPDINLSDPSIPPAVRPFIEQMVAKRPEDRFQTPTMVRRAITALVTGKELPPLPVTPTSAKIDKEAMARSLFHRAEEAMQEKEWQKAVSLLNQTITLDPHHPHAAEALAEAGSQARIAALYKAAGQAMESNRWQEAIDELTEILETTPDYKNSAALMTQARAALEKETSELQLPQLYEQALAAFEAGDYPRAQELFAQVKDISPTYRRADALWAESKRRNTRSGSFKRLSQKITPRQQKSGFPLAWMAATAVIVLGIVAAVLIVGRNNAPPPTPTPALSNLYTRAEQALNENNLTQAASLLGQIAALAPTDPALAPLQKQLARQQTVNDRLSTAQAAAAAREWTNAIEILEPLRDQAPAQAGTITALLCNAYLARGQERLAKISNPRDRATVKAALADFNAGLQLCDNSQKLAAQADYATGYLTALQPDAAPTGIINTLQPLVAAEPDYAGGQAAQNLYLAYLQRGDNRQQAGDPEAALEDYTAALLLNVEDLSAAQQKQAQALQHLAAAQTTTPAPADGSPTAPPPPETPTPAETPSPSSPTPASAFKYAAPALLEPQPMAEFAGEFAEITLSWEPVGSLAEDEFYDVTIRYFVGEEPRYWGSGLIKETSWRVPREAGYGQAGKDRFDWWVTVRRQSSPDAPLSPHGEERTFIWKP